MIPIKHVGNFQFSPFAIFVHHASYLFSEPGSPPGSSGGGGIHRSGGGGGSSGGGSGKMRRESLKALKRDLKEGVKEIKDEVKRKKKMSNFKFQSE